MVNTNLFHRFCLNLSYRHRLARIAVIYYSISFIFKSLLNMLPSARTGLSRISSVIFGNLRLSSFHTSSYRPHPLIPIVVEKSGAGERAYDIYSRLLKDRIVCLMGQINDDVASITVAQLLFLQAEDKRSPIHLYINSPGGIITSGMAIYDTMQHIQPPVHTWCIGQACSMGSLLLTAGAPGHRYALPHARIMIHQPSGAAHGQASDIQIHAQEILKIRKVLNDLYAEHTKQPLEVGFE